MNILRFLAEHPVLLAAALPLMILGVFGPFMGIRRRDCRKLHIAGLAASSVDVLLRLGVFGPSVGRVLLAGIFIYALIREIRAFRKDDDDDRPPRRRRARRRRWVPDLSRLAWPAVLPSPGPA